MIDTKVITPTTVSDRLRVLADWFETHPKALVPYDLKKDTWYMVVDDKEALKNIGSFTKSWTDYNMYADVTVAEGVTLRYFINRNKVCTSRVVGKRMVPETEIEGTPTRIIPAHEEDVIEWDCAPILGEDSNADEN